jgi:putative nucleotidyltransferase with HDIG domain
MYQIQSKVDLTIMTNSLENDNLIEGYFRFGCCYASMAKDNRHAWTIDLYQRKTMLTGKALASDISVMPNNNDIVKIKGKVISCGDTTYVWIREMSVVEWDLTNICSLDLANPGWITNQNLADEFITIWYNLDIGFRELINQVLADSNTLKCFLSAPGSIRHHHSYTGGCFEHTVLVAKTASAICDLNKDLNKNLLITGAILHDIGKTFEYIQNTNGGWRMSEIGKKVGHKLNGAMMIAEAAKKCMFMDKSALNNLLNMITCSYAPAWAGYRSPNTPEAHALSAIDRLCTLNTLDH